MDSAHSEKSAYVIRDPPAASLKLTRIDIRKTPKVSFCIPTFNNEVTLENCLKSISEQSYSNFEIIIVDGGSKDNTINIAKKYTDKIYFYDGPLGGARQLSIDASSGSILALFDSDIIIPHKDWLANSILFFNYSNNISTVWPNNIPPPNASIVSKLYFKHWRLIEDNRMRTGKGFVGGGNSLFIRDCFNSIGGINTSIHWGEDADWALKLRQKGYRVVYITDPLYHDTMRTLGQFTRKQFVGARTFTKTGFEIMELGFKDVIFEQYILGTLGMVKGLIHRDVPWILFPLFLLIKTIAYSWTLLKNIGGRIGKREVDG